MSVDPRLVLVSIAAFLATNMDCLVVLLFFYCRINNEFRPKHILLGEYLGFSILILLSLPGFLGGYLISKSWIGLLGLMPMFLGLKGLVESNVDIDEELNTKAVSPFFRRGIFRYFNPYILEVMFVQIGNGGDNVATYIPLFASLKLNELLLVIAIFYFLVGLFCALAYYLTRVPKVAYLIERYVNRIVPYLYIALGVYIIGNSYFW